MSISLAQKLHYGDMQVTFFQSAQNLSLALPGLISLLGWTIPSKAMRNQKTSAAAIGHGKEPCRNGGAKWLESGEDHAEVLAVMGT